MQARTISYLRCAAYFRLLPRTRILQNRQDTQTHSRRRSYARSDDGNRPTALHWTFSFFFFPSTLWLRFCLSYVKCSHEHKEEFRSVPCGRLRSGNVCRVFPQIKSDYFSHGKCSQNGANSKSFDASETNACDQCGGCQTYDIKGYFYF